MTELANTKGLENHELTERFLLMKVAKDTYKCQHKAYIDKSMGSELKMMIQILSNPKIFSLETPIAHMIYRYPEFFTYGNAFLEAGGGYSENLFWWHEEWPDGIQALTIKNLTVTRRCK